MNFSTKHSNNYLTRSYLSSKGSLNQLSEKNKLIDPLKQRLMYGVLTIIGAAFLSIVINSYSQNKDQSLALTTQSSSELICNSNANRTGYALGCETH